MSRTLTVCATVGSLAIGAVWLAGLVQWYLLPANDCTSSAPPAAAGADNASEALAKIVSLPAFAIASLVLSAFFFLLFFLQLFYHDRLAHEVLLEDLADAAATAHFPSVLSSLCSSFTHSLILLFNTLITLTLILLCLLGLAALRELLEDMAGFPREAVPPSCALWKDAGVYLVVLDFLGACMFFVATGWRCISRCWTDEESAPTNSGPSNGVGVGGLIRAAAEGRGQDRKGKGRKGNVKYSAVEGEDEEDDDELFHADALDGGADEHSDIQRGLQLTAADDDVEMMDMLDQHSKPAASRPTKDAPATVAAASSSAATAAGKSVPILPPPRVSEADGEEKGEAAAGGARGVGLPGDAETEDDYDYGSVSEDGEDEDEQKEG